MNLLPHIQIKQKSNIWYKCRMQLNFLNILPVKSTIGTHISCNRKNKFKKKQRRM